MLTAYIATISKCIIYGMSILFTGALTESTDVLDVLALRYALSMVVLWLLKTLKVMKISVGIRDIICKKPSTRIKNLMLTALFEPVIYMLFEALGASMSTGITAAVILSLPPIVGCFAESIILKERTTPLQRIFLCTGIVGVIYIAMKNMAMNPEDSSRSDTPLGIIFLLGAVISTVMFQTLARKYSDKSNPFEISYVSCILATVIFNAVNVVRHIANGTLANYFDPLFDKDKIVGFVFLGIVCTVIALSLSLYALSKIQVSTFSALSGFTTIVSIIGGVTFFGEKIYSFHYIGFACILVQMIGVSVISIRKAKKQKE